MLIGYARLTQDQNLELQTDDQRTLAYDLTFGVVTPSAHEPNKPDQAMRPASSNVNRGPRG